jgi:hypothetical protein
MGAAGRSYHELALERKKVAIFPLAWTIVHPIDEVVHGARFASMFDLDESDGLLGWIWAVSTRYCRRPWVGTQSLEVAIPTMVSPHRSILNWRFRPSLALS